MNNVTIVSMDSKTGILTLAIDTNLRGSISPSGKTIQVASTLGNVPVAGAPAEFRLGVNAYVSNPDAAKTANGAQTTNRI